jgi:hypothetical protein
LCSVKYGNNNIVNVLNFSEKEYLDDNKAKGMWIYESGGEISRGVFACLYIFVSFQHL